MDRNRLPTGEGVTFKGPPVDEHGRVSKYAMRLGDAEALGRFEEYAFFTPAVLYLHANFTDAPLIDFMYEMREEVKLLYKKFNRPIFRGLETSDGDGDWNHVLWAVHRDHWDALHDFMVSVTLSFSLDKQLIRVGSQELTVLDPLAVDRQPLFRPDLPSLKVTAFGINGSKFRAAFLTGTSLLMDPPTLKFFAPADDIRVFTRAFFEGRNPVDARTNFINAQKLKEEGRES